MFIMRQQVNYTGNVTAAEYTSSLDIFYVMCYKEIKDISLTLQWRSI